MRIWGWRESAPACLTQKQQQQQQQQKTFWKGVLQNFPCYGQMEIYQRVMELYSRERVKYLQVYRAVQYKPQMIKLTR